MEKIKIETNEKIGLNLIVQIQLMWANIRVRISVSVTILFALFITIAITLYPEHRGTLLFLVILVIGMWITPIASSLIDVVIAHRDKLKPESRLIIYLDDNGVELDEESTKIILKWNRFCGFRETKKRFTLITKRAVDADMPIAKRHISEEQIDEVREMLRSHMEEFK